MKKILYISYDGMTDPLGQSQVIPYLTGLAKKGYLFHLISCEKKEHYNSKKQAIDTLLKEHNITWHPLPYTKTPAILSTLWDLYRIKEKIKTLHLTEKFDLLHCRSYIASLMGLWTKKKYGIKLIFDMRGFWADERAESQLWNLKNPVYKIIYNYFKKKELDFLTHADYTISLTQAAKKEIHSRININKNTVPIEVIPCCVDTVLFNKNNIDHTIRNYFKSKLKIENTDFILSYLGSLGTWYLLDEMLAFFKTLLLLKPNAKFLFITSEHPDKIYHASKKNKIPKEKIIVQAAERAEVPVLLSLSQASVFFIKPCFSKTASSPTKLGEIISLGIPCICNTLGDITPLMTSCIITLQHFNEKDYDQAIKKLNTLLPVSYNEAIQFAKNTFSLDGGIAKYESVYKKISGDC